MRLVFPTCAALTVLTAGAATVTLLVKGPSPTAALGFLTRHDELGYAAWFGWLLAAPALLLVAALLARRTPWAWVVGAAVHLASVLAGAVVASHWVPWWGWAAVTAAVVVGLVSIVASLELPTIRHT